MINLLSLAYAEYSYIIQCWILAGSAIVCPTHKPCYACRAENSFYKFGKNYCGCQQYADKYWGLVGLRLGLRLVLGLGFRLGLGLWLALGSV